MDNSQARLEAVEAVLEEWEQSYGVDPLPAHWGITARIAQFREALATEILEPDYDYKVLPPSALRCGDIFTDDGEDWEVIRVCPRVAGERLPYYRFQVRSLEYNDTNFYSLGASKILDVSRPRV